MIISLFAGGMAVRDIGHHLARTLGVVELSHETISNITDAVLEEVRAWQSRPLEEVYPILHHHPHPPAPRCGCPRRGLRQAREDLERRRCRCCSSPASAPRTAAGTGCPIRRLLKKADIPAFPSCAPRALSRGMGLLTLAAGTMSVVPAMALAERAGLWER